MTIMFACALVSIIFVACVFYVCLGICRVTGGRPDDDEDDVASALEGTLIPFVTDLNRTKV